jgi:Bacterial alpha-L-rhamnosidase 6 hairpin glycosidase domain/Bacterial alpha-L-rhamnosidase C-terminal domain
MGRRGLWNYFFVLFTLGWMLPLSACSYYFKTISDDDYNLPPSSRTLTPVAVQRIHGSIISSDQMVGGGTTTLSGKGSYIVLDFGKEVGGIPSLQFGTASDNAQSLFLAFSESVLYTGPQSDRSDGGHGQDGSLSVPVTAEGAYTVPPEKLRGGFRYLTVGLQTAGPVELTGVTLSFTAAPALADLRAYSGSFRSNDDLLNRVWYAGAYTVQTNTIDPQQGRIWPPPRSSWFNNGVSGSGTTILVDGAKRDRLIWPGDLGISALTAYVSTGDTLSVKNDLDTLFAHQDSSGGLPFVGPEANFGTISDTYHLWTLNVVINYYLYSGDRSWVIAHWPQIKKAVAFSLAKIGAHGLLSVNLKLDWGRPAPGGEEISANALLFQVLQGTSFLASIAGDTAAQSAYSDTAASVRSAINMYLWDAGAGMYVDAPGSSLHPQDGNSLAVWFEVPNSTAKSVSISTALKRRWNGFGALTPEHSNTIANFPGSMEVLAHFVAGDDVTALSLIRMQWGYMLSNPYGTGGTFWEGYLQDGEFDGDDYTSLAHGWATGPTSGLTNYVAGIGPELSTTVPFHVIPHPGDLTQASATVSLPQGTVSSTWRQNGGAFVETVTAPAGVAGRYGIPTGGQAITVSMDGQKVSSTCGAGAEVQPGMNVGKVDLDGGYVYLSSVSGSHTVTATKGC